MIESSLPETLNVTGLDLKAPDEPVSTSVAVTVPMAVWFSLTLNDAEDVNTGALSFKSTIVMVMSWVVELVPSEAVTVAEYEFLVS